MIEIGNGNFVNSANVLSARIFNVKMADGQLSADWQICFSMKGSETVFSTKGSKESQLDILSKFN